MAALVAKSYQNLEQVGDVYQVNGRDYIQVRMKNGSLKQVRAYSQKEYAKYNPEVKIIQPAKSRRDTLGFGEKGYIWIFKGETYENLDWFHLSPCRYARTWGWYLPSNEEMPDPIPVNIEPVKLEWADVSFEDELIPEDQIVKVVDSLIYEKGTSRHVGEVGDRIEDDVVCTRATSSVGAYGMSYFYVFTNSEGVVYTWGTSAKVLEQGKSYHIRGTLKSHEVYRNNPQNALTRCKVEELSE